MNVVVPHASGAASRGVGNPRLCPPVSMIHVDHDDALTLHALVQRVR